MTPANRPAASARWLVPEVVQTSAMDCGPATLKCLLEGFGIPVSYGRLREACQTSVDGTSIDTLEVVAHQMGLVAEQVMVPVDHLLLAESQALPAIVVVRQQDGATHFVLAWRRHGAWLQIMDPAVGRRWVRAKRFVDEVFRHATPVPAVAWREWAATGEFTRPLLRQLGNLGASPTQAGVLLDKALADPLWSGPAALDACVRFVRSVVNAGGLSEGAEAVRLVTTLVERLGGGADMLQTIPPACWSVEPVQTDDEGGLLSLKGAVLIRVTGRRDALLPNTGDSPGACADACASAGGPSRELLAALHDKPVSPLRTVWGLLRQDGVWGPWVLGGAVVISAAMVLMELLLFRGLIDVAWALSLPVQRLMAMLALVAFLAILMIVEVPILTEAMRHGRHLDVRLRAALLEKLPHLSDRYFHSRPVSDMADRSHSIHLARLLPGYGLHLIQHLCDLGFTLLGIALIDMGSLGPALVVALVAVAVPALVQPLLNERDLRVRNHAGALHVFSLDALLGLVPIRTHGAERVVRRQHEGLLVEWARARRGLFGMSLVSQAVQSTLSLLLAVCVLWEHFTRVTGVGGADLLLVFWVLKLPALGQSLNDLAQQYPALRNVLLRLLEPLNTPPEEPLPNAEGNPPPSSGPAGAAIHVRGGRVVAGGHTILDGLDLDVAPGEHVAVVGSSGAGKSTLVGLLLGWHRLSEGQLRVDGEALTPHKQGALRRECAWVDPAIQIWNASFLDNLHYASDAAPADRLEPVLEQARLRRVLQRLPEGLQTHLGEAGALISGGEGQRVRLARALMQTGVRLALLDEPFRGLEREQRQTLLVQTLQWWQSATVLCVTHDVAETLSFKRVLVVEGGRIVEDGEPASLARTPSRYRELLDAEKAVREQMWQGSHWRRVQLGDLQP